MLYLSYYTRTCTSVRHLLKYILNYLPQWRYDHITATYLLLLSKKQRGKPVRLRPEPAVCEDSCSPLHQGLQVRFRTRASMMLCSFKAAYSWYWYILLLWILFFYSISVRPEKLCTSVRMKTLWLWIPWTFAQTTSMIAPGFQFHSTHPRGSEVSQMES